MKSLMTRPAGMPKTRGREERPAQAARGSLIQWPTEKEIGMVSAQLVEIRRAAIRSEADGDYSRSGDLAYQLHEILRATADLLKKSRRAKG